MVGFCHFVFPQPTPDRGKTSITLYFILPDKSIHHSVKIFVKKRSLLDRMGQNYCFSSVGAAVRLFDQLEIASHAGLFQLGQMLCPVLFDIPLTGDKGF